MGEIKTLANILSWFKRGMEPTEQQFEDTFTSFWHKEDDLIPISSVDGLAEELNNKYDKDAGAELEERVETAEKRIDGCDVEVSVIQDTLGQMDSLVMHKNVTEIEDPSANRILVWFRRIVPVYESGQEISEPFPIVVNIEGSAVGESQPIRTTIATRITGTTEDCEEGLCRSCFDAAQTSTIDYGSPLDRAFYFMTREEEVGLYLDYKVTPSAIRVEGYSSSAGEWNEPYGTDLIENIETIESLEELDLDIFDSLELAAGDETTSPSY